MSNHAKVLIVDDDEGDRHLMQQAIDKANLDIELMMIETGEEGIDRTQTMKPEIVVLDAMMPDMDGYQVCQKIKDQVEDVKVIICTGVVDAVDAGRARAAGADDFCVKTSDYESLMQSIRSLLLTEIN